MSLKLQHPIPGAGLRDRFGWRAAIPGVVAAQLHTGQDWAAHEGTPVRAMHPGRITRTWWDTMASGAPGGGNMIELGAANATSRYAHLSAYAVSPGDEVQAGQIIGYVGATGAATGPHLHAELLINGQFADPLPYITSTPQHTIQRRHSMASLYHTTSNDKRGGPNPTYCLAGDSPGTPANWIESKDASVGTGWAVQHGNSMWLTKASAESFKKQYLAPLKIAK